MKSPSFSTVYTEYNDYMSSDDTSYAYSPFVCEAEDRKIFIEGCIRSPSKRAEVATK